MFVSSVLWLLLLSCSFSFGVESDINCLKSIKASFEDTLGSLNSSWDFSNNTEGFICNFRGIECWHPHESKVLNIKLSELGLKGQFPRGVENCTSLTGLDLSGNMLSGPLPHDIDKILTWVTSLDLSSNSFSGLIPATLSNCSYMNVLKLDNNQFSGNIPAEVYQLTRLRTFSVANNLLSGQVPPFGENIASIRRDSYANNSGLCGYPLKPCPSISQKTSLNVVRVFKSNGVLMVAAAGFVSSILLLLLNRCSFSFGVESDINCLRSIKASLEDTLGYLNSSWDFNNNTEGFICYVLGIECWHPYESKVLNIKLSELGLKGQFPRGVENCTSLTGLDPSSNQLSGPLPHDIDKILSFITSLDLSFNSFSGLIPPKLSNCSYMNVLKLDNNQLSGNIPAEFNQLTRLKTFSVANNPGLCGYPLKPCPPISQKKSVSVARVFKSNAHYPILMAFLMHMLLRKQDAGIFIGSVLWLLLSCSFSVGVESDINCLKSIKASLEDTLGYLNSSWDFSNNTEGFICNFLGVECWHPHESKVLNLKLSDLGLKGSFPQGVANCTSLTGLDLSSNQLNGPLPTDIDKIITFITSLDLSYNSFTGQIPMKLSNCSYLNVLKLDNNKFSGIIPPEISQLARIKTFSVANNQLSGPVPNFNNTSIGPESYANNTGLCGGPLKHCPPV
ncbi:PREDICTED: probable LRR receptor-like serine/threonine-protein kinase At1g34110 [Prunus mume]|uniref:Probable LRR receptor-like serine/threonine-protein kinase At1g34110 n=1 Tax=Prunus mume TaxID=102107 RepID=A0ABM1LSM6_PRUMU|nr:PREDICTED: probable LRR receptor-like serine/threonine-protein kinase At1g34110 [Prunus mume]